MFPPSFMTSAHSLSKSSRAFNRQSVQGAIRALQTALKRYKTIPTNGLAMFAGVQPIASASDASSSSSSSSSNERDRLMVREIEPLKPLKSGLYYCDGRFHVEQLLAQFSDETPYGFVIIDGSGCNFYQVSGDAYQLLWKHGDPALPKKHGRGGQSAPRFGRLRAEKRAAYVSAVAKQMNNTFIDKSSGNTNVAGIILCGAGELKQQLAARTNVLDAKISAAIMPTLIDLQYGGQSGLNEAIKKASSLLADHSIGQQRGILLNFMESISNDDGLVAFGIRDTLYALNAGAVSTLLVSDSLSCRLITYKNRSSQEKQYDYIAENKPIDPLPPSMRKNTESSITGEVSEEESSWIVESQESLWDHLMNTIAQQRTHVQLISPSSTQGAQFEAAFGGIGAILSWSISLPSNEDQDVDFTDEDEGYDFSDF